MLEGVFREEWEKERQEYIKKLGSKEYGCDVDYTCSKIDSMRDVIKDRLVGRQVAAGNEGVLDSLLNNLEGLRKSITELRDWGHDLRYLLLKTDAETESVFEKVRDIHGDGYTYERREGTEVDLTELESNQRVCAGGTGWHILMTKKVEAK